MCWRRPQTLDVPFLLTFLYKANYFSLVTSKQAKNPTNTNTTFDLWNKLIIVLVPYNKLNKQINLTMGHLGLLFIAQAKYIHIQAIQQGLTRNRVYCVLMSLGSTN